MHRRPVARSITRGPRLLAFGLSLFLAACGGTTTTTTTTSATSGGEDGDVGAATSTGEGASPDHEVARAALDGGPCPESFASTPPGCDGPVGTCVRADGAVCGCREPVWCGGAYPPPMPRTWTCDLPDPPCAAAGTPCTPGEPACGAGPCGFGGGMACVGGVWTPQMPGPLPP